ERQDQGDERLLVPGVRGQDVLADALRHRALVQQTVALGLGQRRGYRVPRQRLELVHATSSAQNPSARSTRLSGSKNRSTTRSFNGMMALSVIVMCSGHTFVQHLVMLQSPTPNACRSSPTRSAVSSGCISSAATCTRKRGPMNWSCIW